MTDGITAFANACRRLMVPPTPQVLLVSTQTQAGLLLRQQGGQAGGFPFYTTENIFRVSTARSGTGQQINSLKTPLGLHRIAQKIGGFQLKGTIFKARQPVGLTWQGQPEAEIAHRILWLDGMEPGFNNGGNVDSFGRYIYIHGVGNERWLGRPRSQGCIHMAAADLIPWFDGVPTGTLVWIGEFPLLHAGALS